MDVMDTCSEGEEVRDLGEEDVLSSPPPGLATPPIPSGPLNATPMLVDGPQSPPPILPIPPVTSLLGSTNLDLSAYLESVSTQKREPSEKYLKEREICLDHFSSWTEQDQIEFVEELLKCMQHHQHGTVNAFLKPMLQRDFISLLPKKGLDHVAENILSFLDARSLCYAGSVSREWSRVISEGMLWKKLIERKVNTDSLWKGLADRRGWIQYLFKPKPGESHPPHSFYRRLYPSIIKDIDTIEDNWRCGKHNLQRINCRSENSKGVYCLQYDDSKIVSGLRDNTIKMWDRQTLQQYSKVLTGHTGSVLCLQYDDKVIISGSSDSTVRVWDVETGEMVNTLIHHCEAVLHLSFNFKNGMMVTCSKDRSIAVWDMISPTEINLRRVLVGHRAAVNVVDFDEKYIVSASGDRTIKVWSTSSCGPSMVTREGSPVSSITTASWSQAAQTTPSASGTSSAAPVSVCSRATRSSSGASG